MKKLLLILTNLVFICGLSFANLVIENCITGKYSAYYPSDCKNGSKKGKCICGYYDNDNRLYLGTGKAYYDYFNNIADKEIIFSSRSKTSIKDFGDFINDESLPEKKNGLSLLYSNWVPSDSPNNVPVMFLVTGVTLKTIPSSFDTPVGYIEFTIRGANVDSNGNYTINPSSFPVKEFGYATATLENGYFDINGWVSGGKEPKKISTGSIFNHYQYYLFLPSRCGDGHIQSDEGEKCDNGSNNWNGNGAPTIVNGVACNTSCQIVKPTCGEAAGNYSADETNFHGEGLPADNAPTGQFCSNYGVLDGSTPSFPSPGSSTSWTCKLGNQTVTCTATRANTTPPSNGGERPGNGTTTPQCGTASGHTFNSAPTTNLCSVGTPSEVTENTTSWTWTCSAGGNSVSCTAYKSTCAIQGTCTNGQCGYFNGQTFDPTNPIDLPKLLKFENPSASDPDFCTGYNGDTMLLYNPSVDSKEFTWHCGFNECHAKLKYLSGGTIKIYGAYSGFTTISACPECIQTSGFDLENLDNGTYKKFISDYDTTYTRSVMSGDYLPFGWIIPKYNKYVTTCNASNVGKYNKNTLKVKFTVGIYTKELNGFGGSLPAFPDNSVNGQGYIPASIIKTLPNRENEINGYITYRQTCEGIDTDGDGSADSYQWIEETTNTQFATQTFVKTDHYMVQLNPVSSYGNTSITFNGSGLNWWLSQEGLTPPNSLASYTKAELEKVLSGFVNKYKSYAILPNSHLDGMAENFHKVPTQRVYYYSGNITLNEGLDFSNQPTTLIVENGDVTVRPNITGPFMLVVKNGKIKIENQNMNTKSILEGYYITDKGFEVINPTGISSIYNSNPSSSKRFSDGRLQINGALIGPDAEKIYLHRRSLMKNWFRPGYGPAWAIVHGASLLINPNPTLWTNPPIGSKDILTQLKILKGY